VSSPRIAVVTATHDSAPRLSLLLEALRAQTLPRARFEVAVVDDGSGDRTPQLLAEAQRAGDLDLHVLRREPTGGPASACNLGWRAARAPLIAFTGDDCRPTAGWLEAYLAAAQASPGVVLQGMVLEDPEQRQALDPSARAHEVRGYDEGFAAANMLYPRDLLEQLGGFDESFVGLDAGYDTDLGWRAIECGAEVRFVPEALVHLAAVEVGAAARLRSAGRLTTSVRLYRRHPGMTKVKGVFWRHHHWELFRFALALALPSRLGPLRLYLAAPYVKHLTDHRAGPLLAPYLLALDLAEVIAIVRGAIRYRVVVL
jgi:GT2 family glycosyltransferase